MAAAWEASQWGLSTGGDTPAFAGMHEAAAAVCGASVAGAMAVWEGRADQAFFAGGAPPRARHRSRVLRPRPSVASGAPRRRRRSGRLHDIDVHHATGPIGSSRGSSRAHVLGPRFRSLPLPVTGTWRRGIGPAPTSVTIPLRLRRDRPHTAIEEIIAPEVLDSTPGNRSRTARPAPRRSAGHLLTMPASPRLPSLHSLARDAADWRCLALGGGGHLRRRASGMTLLFSEMLEPSSTTRSRRAGRARPEVVAVRCRGLCRRTPSEVAAEERSRSTWMATGHRWWGEAAALRRLLPAHWPLPRPPWRCRGRGCSRPARPRVLLDGVAWRFRPARAGRVRPTAPQDDAVVGRRASCSRSRDARGSGPARRDRRALTRAGSGAWPPASRQPSCEDAASRR